MQRATKAAALTPRTDIDECDGVDLVPAAPALKPMKRSPINTPAPGNGYEGGGINTAYRYWRAGADCGAGGTCNEADGETVANQYTCTCATGYEGGGINTDVPISMSVSATALKNRTDGCETVANQYTCTCATGYEGGGINTECTDIDECDGLIVVPATCTEADAETVANQYTRTCATGYEGGGINTACTDIMCAGVDCGAGGNCTEADGETVANQYTRTCAEGYEGGGINTACADIDECTGVDSGAGGTGTEAMVRQSPINTPALALRL